MREVTGSPKTCKAGLNSNALKFIAIAAMTVDHVTSVVYPDYPTAPAIYSVVYMVFINPLYGGIQMFVVLAIPLLKMYNGERGEWKGMKYFFYVYYPAHLIAAGILRITLHGNVGVMIGG